MKNLNPNDPEFTAKALGEDLENRQHEEISKQHLEAFESLRAFVEILREEVNAEPGGDTLEHDRVDAIKQKGLFGRKPKKLFYFPAWVGGIAAVMVVSFLLPKYLNTSHELLETPEVGGSRYERDELSSQIDIEAGPQRPDDRDRLKEVSIVLDGNAKPRPVEDVLVDRPETAQRSGRVVEREVVREKPPYPEKTQPVSNSVSKKMEAKPITLGMVPPALQLNSMPAVVQSFDRENYAPIDENTFRSPLDHALSTFSIDVDTASYSNVRRMIRQNRIPPVDSVRIEEFVNYFNYTYAAPLDDSPFAVHLDTTSAPWCQEHRLVRIALKGKELDLSERPNANLVFLVDVSGSMNQPNKLPLVKKSLTHVIEKMSTEDRIAIVVYAGASGLALPSTTANNHETIQHALDRLSAGGSTNGGAGIELAYQVASEHFIADGINRVVLCTDGDFNVGTSDQGSLQRLIEEKAKTGVFFSAIGFGSGNYQDATMELLSNKGNGNYAYIDSEREARKVFVENLLGTLYTIAKDVKIQVEFNPAQVASYRLIGYENRKMAKEDFNNDKKDAGEIGAGHTVTALYEIVPVGIQADVDTGSVDALRYQKASEVAVVDSSGGGELLTVKLRYKAPDGDTSKLMVQHLQDDGERIDAADIDFRWAVGVSAWAMKLRKSAFVETFDWAEIEALLRDSIGEDRGGHRSELLELVSQSHSISLEG